MLEVSREVPEQQSSTLFIQRSPQEGSIGRNVLGVEVSTSSRRGKINKALIESGHSISSTRETQIPGTDISRGIVERFERGELFRSYTRFKRDIKAAEKQGKDATSLREEFKEFREKSTDFKKKLDVLNRQFYPYPNDWDRVHVKDSKLGEHNIPVVTLDLHSSKEGENDERTPYFLVPTYIANPYQVAFFAMSLALEGQRVHVMTYPEKYKMSGSSPEWLDVVKDEGRLTLAPYAKLAEKIIDNMGLQSVNLVGTSMGAAVALEMAQDQEFSDKINDLIVVDPPSLVKRNSSKYALYDFGFKEGVIQALDREKRIKGAQSERPDLGATMGRVGGWFEAHFLWAPMLAKAQITKEKISKINPKGKFQVWVGEESAVTGEATKKVLLEAERQRRIELPDSQPMKLIVVKGAHHLTLLSRLGVASVITQKQDSEETIVNIDEKDLIHSGAQAITTNHYTSN